MDAALPLPTPSPLDPAPVTIATLPSSLRGRSAIGTPLNQMLVKFIGQEPGPFYTGFDFKKPAFTDSR
jgi:hypothetical protein